MHRTYNWHNRPAGIFIVSLRYAITRCAQCLFQNLIYLNEAAFSFPSPPTQRPYKLLAHYVRANLYCSSCLGSKEYTYTNSTSIHTEKALNLIIVFFFCIGNVAWEWNKLCLVFHLMATAVWLIIVKAGAIVACCWFDEC